MSFSAHYKRSHLLRWLVSLLDRIPGNRNQFWLLRNIRKIDANDLRCFTAHERAATGGCKVQNGRKIFERINSCDNYAGGCLLFFLNEYVLTFWESVRITNGITQSKWVKNRQMSARMKGMQIKNDYAWKIYIYTHKRMYLRTYRALKSYWNSKK